MSSEITKHHVIESILDNESITDGLEDEDAQHIIQWCLEKVELMCEGFLKPVDQTHHILNIRP